MLVHDNNNNNMILIMCNNFTNMYNIKVVQQFLRIVRNMRQFLRYIPVKANKWIHLIWHVAKQRNVCEQFGMKEWF